MSQPPKFHVGQAVVCLVDTSGWTLMHPTSMPQKGVIYTVSEVVYEYSWDRANNQAYYFIMLAELPQNQRWLADCFAPVELLPDEALAELLAETLDPVAA